MKAVCLILGVGLLIASLACITWTVVEVIRKDCGLGSARFWGAAAFHAVTATVACALLSLARRRRAPEAEPPAPGEPAGAGEEGQS